MATKKFHARERECIQHLIEALWLMDQLEAHGQMDPDSRWFKIHLETYLTTINVLRLEEVVDGEALYTYSPETEDEEFNKILTENNPWY